MNKDELDDFVHTVKAARTAQKVVAVVDQHPNLCLFFKYNNNYKLLFIELSGPSFGDRTPLHEICRK